ncbi:PREDICTED: uncharacterized protein LOC107101062 [Cyprinodon variegatus]|uniref:uncharacterized protein LOC107101062 n=1 Tax=Cyprinodon variegatus TaxID=28743 RepID=UPI0007427D42|nr:PREDICTED: uncharacterized protein LOC107101062 [Cyprinodon variegatus]
MGNSSTYPVFFKCYNLHPDQEKEIENYFHTWTSSGGSCESLKRESKYVYSFAFRNKKDQQAVLRKAKHTVNLTDSCSLTFTVQNSLKAASSPSNVTLTAIQQHSTPFSISPAPPTGENSEQDIKGLIAKIIVLTMLGLQRINPEETRNLVKRYWKSKADNNHEVLTSQHKRSNNNDKACQTMDPVEHRQSGINDSGLSQKMPFINSNKGDPAVAYNLKNGLQMMVCLGDITRLDTDTLMTIPVDDLDHSNGASFLSEAFRSKSLTMPFYSSGPFGVPLSICTEAIVNAVRQYSSQGGRMVSRIILIDNRNHVVKGMLEVCDNLFQGISHGCRSFSSGRFQIDPAEEDTVRTSDEGVAEVAGDSVYVEVVMGTIETQQVDAVVSPMVGHNPLSSGLGRTLNEIVGPQLMSRFRNTAGNESVPGDSVLLKGLPRLPSGAVFFLNLIPWDDDDDGTAVQVLRLGINSILTSCKRQGFESISLPVLGVGMALRFPESVVAKVLREEIQSFEWSQDRSKPLLVRIVLQPNITSTQCRRSIELQLQELLTTLDNTAKKTKEGYGKCISVNAWIKLTDNKDRSGSNAFFGSSLVVLQVAEKSVNIDGKGEDDAKENEATTSGQAQSGGTSKGREFGGIWYPVLGSIGAVIGAAGTFSSGAAGIGGAGMRATGGGGTGEGVQVDQRVEEAQVEQQVEDAAQVEQHVGEAQLEQQVGEAQVEQHVEEAQVEQQVGEAQVEQQVEEAQVEQQVGEAQVEYKL